MATARTRQPTTKPNKGKWLNVQQKYKVILQHQRFPSASCAKLAEWARREFALQDPPSRETIRLILKATDVINKKRLDAKTAKGKTQSFKCPTLEIELERFVDVCKAQYVCLSRRLLVSKAKKIMARSPDAPPLKLSPGWLSRFMSRHGLRFRTMHGEAASVSPATVCEAHMAMQDVTRFYELKDVWNMDETGLMYRSAKDRAICRADQPGLKKDKTRITLPMLTDRSGSSLSSSAGPRDRTALGQGR